MTVTPDIVSTRDAYERVEALTDEDHASLMLNWAIRSDDRTLAVAILQRAETQGWDGLARFLRGHVDHDVKCPAERIEVTDYPELGKSTTHCLDCGAHRLHDGSGLPVIQDGDGTPITAEAVSFRPAPTVRTSKGRPE